MQKVDQAWNVAEKCADRSILETTLCSGPSAKTTT